MGNWQLIAVILASVFMGALIPVFITLAIFLNKANKEIADIGERLIPTLNQIQIISDRVEVLSRGFDGGAQNISELMTAIGSLARGLERNMKIINVSSAIVAVAGPAIAAFMRTMHQEGESVDSAGIDNNAGQKEIQDSSLTSGPKNADTPSRGEPRNPRIQPLPNKIEGTHIC